MAFENALRELATITIKRAARSSSPHSLRSANGDCTFSIFRIRILVKMSEEYWSDSENIAIRIAECFTFSVECILILHNVSVN